MWTSPSAKSRVRLLGIFLGGCTRFSNFRGGGGVPPFLSFFRGNCTPFCRIVRVVPSFFQLTCSIRGIVIQFKEGVPLFVSFKEVAPLIFQMPYVIPGTWVGLFVVLSVHIFSLESNFGRGAERLNRLLDSLKNGCTPAVACVRRWPRVVPVCLS